MKAILFPAIFFFLGGQAQRPVIDVDKTEGNTVTRNFYVVGGNPVSAVKYVKVVKGTPLFSDKQMMGSLEMPDGQVVDSLLLRLDLLDNHVLFTRKGSSVEMESISPVSKLTLTDPESAEVYSFVYSSALHVIEQNVASGWYQVLVSGRASLYKRIKKIISESRSYNSATYEQSISTLTSYFILSDNAFTQVKKLSAIPEVLTKKRDELSAYLKQNNLSGKKKDADYINVVKYYNDLPAK